MLKNLLRAKGLAAGVLVTAITLLLAGGVLLSTTSVGCGPANYVGLKIGRCITSEGKAARLPLASPSPFSFSPVPTPSPYEQPASTPASSYPPITNPTSGYPYNQPASMAPPRDPFYPPASISGRPAPAMSCRLPIYVGQPGSGGFVLFPEGTYVADPRSAVALPSPSPGSAPPAGPYGGYYGYSGMAYDHAHTRWLPVKSDWVAPDGNHYVYPTTNSLYVVDANSKSQVALATGQTWTPIRVLNDRVYATIQYSPGLWMLPFSGASKQVTEQGYWQAATSVAAYGTVTSAVPQGVTAKLMRLDIATGTVTDWFSRDGANSSVYGFDLEGHPLVMSYYGGPWALWLTTSPSEATVLANSYQGINNLQSPLADSHGIWFYGSFGNYGPPTNGVMIYIRGSGLYWMASYGGQLAGGCA
jgi:hypothetical protein